MNEDPVPPVEAVIARVLQVYRGWGRHTPVAQMRADWDAFFADAPSGTLVETVSAGGVPAEWVVAPGARSDCAVLYLHGGGFQIGSPRSHRELMARISASSGCRVLGLDYRLAPEHRFPAALQDARAGYDWLLEQGLTAGQLALAGDSAGAGLALSLLLAMRDDGQALPAAAVTMSAWTDLSASSPTYQSHAAVDPLNQRPMILAMARCWLGAHVDATDPRASPLFADLHGLPPLLMQAGGRETLLGDTTRFADKARAAGVAVELQVWDGMIHAFQQLPAELAEASEALAAIGAFLRRHLPTTTRTA